MTAPAAVRLLPTARPDEVVAFVDYQDGTSVRVRHEPRRGPGWRCGSCGRRPTTDPCAHASAVALTALVHQLLDPTERD